ncbi:hypothetical protein ACFVR1_08545 [Psychrobacillus sp. NPDC058041]|uniref:hypothetical protein n=1 Tax=Psychrobacillus sp. NPDC058041 TaxID=3346310 RepID=UPI0036D9E210
MKRKLITIFITLLVLLGLGFGVAFFTHTKFIDYSFFIGLAVTVIIWFFTSKGSYGSRHLDMTIQGSTGIRMEGQKFEFSPNIAFYTSLAYTIITIAVTFFLYRSYF